MAPLLKLMLYCLDVSEIHSTISKLFSTVYDLNGLAHFLLALKQRMNVTIKIPLSSWIGGYVCVACRVPLSSWVFVYGLPCTPVHVLHIPWCVSLRFLTLRCKELRHSFYGLYLKPTCGFK
jgi:hypothetical protein